jgi:salicylate hydroxylase
VAGALAGLPHLAGLVDRPGLRRARAAGAGVAIVPNSLRILSSLGLTARLSEIEPRLLPGMAMYTSQGERVGFVGSAARAFHRADLIDLLSSQLEPGTIFLNSKLVSVEEVDEGIVLRFADGRLETAAAVIGADGIHSAVRPFAVEESQPVFSGMVAYRGLVPAERAGDWPQEEA